MVDLKIFTDNIEESALAQINELITQEAFRDSKIRIMPDVHAGKGCVIGFTAEVRDKVVPNLVGVDIGCGMLTVKLDDFDRMDLDALDKLIRSKIPSGRDVSDEADPLAKKLIDGLICSPFLKNKERLYRGLGTLGGGNHFIEIDVDEDGGYYLIIHTGSRNLGKQVAEYYQDLAVKTIESKFDLPGKKSALIAEYKATGRESEIQKALEELNNSFTKSETPKHLAYLDGDLASYYLHDMFKCEQYADANRRAIATKILGIDPGYYDHFTTIHNYIGYDDKIIRKGAISARKGMRVLIPLNMRDGCILGVGKGNPDWNYSAPHGAGRIMSRGEARKRVTLDEFKNTMDGIYTTCVNESTLDESPQAYKPAEEIIEAISETVEIKQILKPIYNFKASE